MLVFFALAAEPSYFDQCLLDLYSVGLQKGIVEVLVIVNLMG